MRRKTTLADRRGRRAVKKGLEVPVICFEGFRDGKIIFTMDGVEREIEYGTLVDLSRAMEDKEMMSRLEMAQWLEQHPEYMLPELARTYCTLYDIPFEEKDGDVICLAAKDTTRVTVYKNPWYYPGAGVLFGEYEYVDRHPSYRKYIAEDVVRKLHSCLIEAIQKKNEQL